MKVLISVAICAAGVFAAFPQVTQLLSRLAFVAKPPATLPADEFLPYAFAVRDILSGDSGAACEVVGIYSTLGTLSQLPDVDTTDDLRQMNAAAIAVIKQIVPVDFVGADRLGRKIDDCLRVAVGVDPGDPIPVRSLTQRDRSRVQAAYESIEWGVIESCL